MSANSPDPVIVEDQRPSLARIYLVVAVVALDVFALVAGLVYRHVAVSRLTLDLEGQAYAVAQRFATTVWPDVSAWAANAAALDPATLRASPEVAVVGQGLARLTAGLQVVDAKVYAKDGTVIYATQADEIGGAATDAVVLDMLAGRYYGRGRPDAHSVVGHVAVAPATGGTPRTREVVTTQVTIRPTSRDVEAVLELGQDATPEIHRIATIEVVGSGGVIATSLAFLALTLYAMHIGRSQKEE